MPNCVLLFCFFNGCLAAVFLTVIFNPLHQKVEAALMFGCAFCSADNELLYRGRDGDVVKLNVDTEHRKVIVPNQWFVSIDGSSRAHAEF